MADKCPVCECELTRPPNETFATDVTTYACPSCGTFAVTVEFFQDYNFYKQRDPLFLARLARYLYETRDKGVRLLTTGRVDASDTYPIVLDIRQAQDLYKIDLSPLQKYERALVNIAVQTKEFGQFLEQKPHHFVVPSLSPAEQQSILLALEQDGYVELEEKGDAARFRLTSKGLARAEEMRRAAPLGPVVFVAASFADELEAARTGLVDVLSELGYEPYIVSQDPHNEIIDLQIYENIRRSRFMVADLTLNRQSVYYEVGFAHGLGLEVVLTCRADSFDGEDDEFMRVHFDLNHRNILCWRGEEDLQEKVRKHILQSFGRYAPTTRPPA